MKQKKRENTNEISIFIAFLPFGTSMEISAAEGLKGGVGGGGGLEENLVKLSYVFQGGKNCDH